MGNNNLYKASTLQKCDSMLLSLVIEQNEQKDDQRCSSSSPPPNAAEVQSQRAFSSPKPDHLSSPTFVSMKQNYRI
jgi:hypothetical protein